MKNKRLFKFLLIYCTFIALSATAVNTGEAPNYTTRVYPGANGKLLYIPDEQGNIIPDFSHAGYGGGGIALPYVPVKETLWPVKGDDASNIQAAIDRISNLPLDANGFRGALLLKQGYYELESPLNIKASGVVLRGEGQGETGTVLIGFGSFKGGYNNNNTANLIVIGGKTCWDEVLDSARRITDDYVPVGTRSFRVESTKGFKVGDTVLVKRNGTQEWINEIGMNLENRKLDHSV